MPRSAALRVAAGLVAVLLPSCGGSGGGHEVLDQANDPPDYTLGTRADSLDEIAQTFTVGVAGRLTAVEVFLEDAGSGGTDDLYVEIRTTTGGVPDPDAGAVLATAIRSSSSLGSPARYERFDLDVEVPVAPGDVLAIVLSGIGSGAAWWWGGGDGTDYGPGAFFWRTPSSGGVFDLYQEPLDPFDEADQHFRTYVRTP